MVLVYEINLYYEVDVLKKIVMDNTTKYLVNIEGMRYVYEESVDRRTGIVSYTLEKETYLPLDYSVEIKDYPNIALIISMYETMKYSSLPRVRITGKDATKKVENGVEQVPKKKYQSQSVLKTEKKEKKPVFKKKEIKVEEDWQDEEVPW